MNDVIVCQISRGVAPVRSIINIVDHCHRTGVPYVPVLGLPAFEAKNAAVATADVDAAALVLVEDDVELTQFTFDSLVESARSRSYVSVCDAIGRRGRSTRFDAAGEIVWSGTVAIALSRDVLNSLRRPVFRPATLFEFAQTGEVVASPVAPQDGSGSDLWLFMQLRKLVPRPTIVDLGLVTHLRHPLNVESDLRVPCVVEPWPETSQGLTRGAPKWLRSNRGSKFPVSGGHE